MCFYLCCQGLSGARAVSINHSGGNSEEQQRALKGKKKLGNYKASIMEAPITLLLLHSELSYKCFYYLSGSILRSQPATKAL